MDYNRELFGTIDRFIRLTINGKVYEVPDRLELLRIFQFLNFHIDYARLCWNGSCKRCIVGFDQNGKSFEAMSCRLKSSDTMCVTRLPPTVQELPVETDPSQHNH